MELAGRLAEPLREDLVQPLLRPLRTQRGGRQDVVKVLDFGIAHGWRGKTLQNALFKEERTNARWGESPHNHMENGIECSKA